MRKMLSRNYVLIFILLCAIVTLILLNTVFISQPNNDEYFILDELQPCGNHYSSENDSFVLDDGIYYSSDESCYIKVENNTITISASEHQIKESTEKQIQILFSDDSLENEKSFINDLISDSPELWKQPVAIDFIRTMHYSPDDKIAGKMSDKTLIVLSKSGKEYQPVSLIVYEDPSGQHIQFGDYIFTQKTME